MVEQTLNVRQHVFKTYTDWKIPSYGRTDEYVVKHGDPIEMEMLSSEMDYRKRFKTALCLYDGA